MLDGVSSQKYIVNANASPEDNIDKIMLMFLNPEFFVLHFYYYTLMTFLMVLSVILLSMMMITTLNSKCDKTFDLKLELELASELVSDLWTGSGCDLLISILKKLNLFHLTN